MESLHPVIRISSLFYGLISLGSIYVLFLDISNGSLYKEPLRLPTTVLVNLFIILRSYRKKRLSQSGAYASFIVGFLHFYSSPAFTGALLAFFLSSSFATRYGQELKKNISGGEFKAGGQRNWIQVMCNGLFSSTGALLFLLNESSGEDAWGSVFGRGVLVANACCSGDTWASELGTVLSSGAPFHILTLQRVPKGTNGGVSPVGILLSFLGGAFVGLNYVWPLMALYPTHTGLALYLIALGGLGGLLGSLIDSVLGSLLQYSGVDAENVIHQFPSHPGVRRICGRNILDNDSVNILSCFLTTLGLVTFLP